MDAALNPTDPRPSYVQVAEVLRSEIEAGQHPEGSQFPTHGQVAERFGVSVGTVKRAYGVLQNQGLIVTRQGQGSIVRSQVDRTTEPTIRELADRLAAVERRLDLLSG